jgi:two-component system OmpR family sensor kinase
MIGRLEARLARERRFVADASHELRTPLALLRTELVLARVDEGRLPLRREEIRVADLLENVAGRVGPGIELDVRDGESVFGDRLRLEQALGNLVDNAVRHGAGTVRLETDRRNGTLLLRVTDEGAGFPPELLPTAFERFTRGDKARERGGTGLGLAIVDAVARAHGGRAHAEGSTVTMELPGE